MRRGASNLAIDLNQVVLTYVPRELPASKILGPAYNTRARLVHSGGPNSSLIYPEQEHEVVPFAILEQSYTFPTRRDDLAREKKREGLN